MPNMLEGATREKFFLLAVLILPVHLFLGNTPLNGGESRVPSRRVGGGKVSGYPGANRREARKLGLLCQQKFRSLNASAYKPPEWNKRVCEGWSDTCMTLVTHVGSKNGGFVHFSKTSLTGVTACAAELPGLPLPFEGRCGRFRNRPVLVRWPSRMTRPPFRSSCPSGRAYPDRCGRSPHHSLS